MGVLQNIQHELMNNKEGLRDRYMKIEIATIIYLGEILFSKYEIPVT